MAFVMMGGQCLIQLKSSSNVQACVKESKRDTENDSNSNRVKLPDKTRNSRVLVLGGTGRVGGSTAIALSKLCPDLGIAIGGRNREKAEAMVAKLGENSAFTEVNTDNFDSLAAAMSDVDLVIHAAGPFQKAETCTVLEAAIETKVRTDCIC